MVCILEHLHQYVPTLSQERRHQVTPTREEVLNEHKFHRLV